MKKPQTSIPLTKEKYQHLLQKKKELIQRIKETQQRLIVAREQGDLSENGAYKYAKIELGSLKRQLRDIYTTLTHGVITEKVTGDSVGFGSVVTVRLLPKGEEVTYTMLSEHESDIFSGKLSLTSPLGRVLLHKSVGDEVRVCTPKGEKAYKIVEVK